MKVTCPNCGLKISSKAKYCNHCGNKWTPPAKTEKDKKHAPVHIIWLRAAVLVAVILFFAMFFYPNLYGQAKLAFGKQPTPKPTPVSTPAPKQLVDTEIIQGLNEERQKYGSSSLSYSATLTKAAQAKANDAVVSNDYTPGSKASISRYLQNVGYNADGSALEIYPEYSPLNSSDFVQLLVSQPDKLSLDGSYTEEGITIVPVNKNGVEAVIVMFLAKPQAPAPAPVYLPPRPLICNAIGAIISCF